MFIFLCRGALEWGEGWTAKAIWQREGESSLKAV